MDQPVKIDSLLAEARLLQETNPARGLELASMAQAQAVGATELAACLLTSGACRNNLADFNAAMADLNRALELFRMQADIAGEAAALDELGACWGQQGDSTHALEYHLQSLSLWQKLNDIHGLSMCLNRLGIRYYYFAQYDTALSYFQQSLALRESACDLAGMAHSYDNLAIIFDKFGDYDQAVAYYQKSQELFERLGSPYELANALMNMAAMLDECLHQPEQARAAFQRVLGLLKGLNKQLEGVCYQGLGNLERGLGKHTQAQLYYRAGLDLLREIGSSELTAEMLVDLGRSQLAQRDLSGAMENLKEALELATLSQANEIIFLAHQWLSETCEQIGDYPAALWHYKEFHRVREAVYSAQTELKVKGLIHRVETDKARQEARFARQEARMALQEAQIARQEAEIAQQQAEIYRLKREELQAALEAQENLLHDLQLKTDDLLHQVWEDALTGIHNRRFLEMRLPEECERARRFGHNLTVVLMDIDDFKHINDRLSHPTGDQVLKTVARILVSVSRSVDLVVRYGGDEFLLAMIEAEPQQAQEVCERLRTAVEKYDWSMLDSDLSVTLSMGLCSLSSLPAGISMVACADERLYQAKRSGKNRIVGAE
jgi:diguanylate cyclase (GGDEF)-like protein